MKHLQLLIVGISLGWLIGMSESAVISSVITSLLSVIVILLTALSGIKKESGETKTSTEKTLLKKITSTGVSSTPIMLILLGIVAGSILGVYCRTHDLLSPKNEFPKHYESDSSSCEEYGINIDAMIEKYKKHGVPDSVIVQRILNIELPKNPNEFNEKSPIGIHISKKKTKSSTVQVIETVVSHPNTQVQTAQISEHKKSVLFSLSSEKCASLCGYKGKDLIVRLKGYSYSNSEIKELLDKYGTNYDEIIRHVKKDCKCEE